MSAVESAEKIPAVSKKRSLKQRLNAKGYKWAPYLFVSPFFVLFAVFGLFPLLFSIYLSLHYGDATGGIDRMEFVGLANYIYLFRDDAWFHSSLINTGWLALASGIPQHVVAIPLAFFLHTAFKKSRNTVIGAYFVPFITSSVAISLVFTSLFSRDFGVVNMILTQIGNVEIFGFQPLGWLFPTENVDWARPQYIKPMIAFVVFWRFVGWNTVLYLSAMQTIPKDLYEAATVDGAKPWQQFFYITLPQLKPMMFFAVTLTIIGNLQMFEEPFIITGGTGGIEQAGKTAAMHLYLTAFTEGDFGTASAVSWLLFFIIAILTWLNNKILGEKD
ncbi:carbohydrate ABC transporter permease [Aliagarivorans taiwanensis]|uniref:carbohydrate ABC transporter permease n=1 Tax=Aliagarivorans taiwanensis TaxID=561966 RepID=UPI0003FEDD59|nr:sugar ABC transporter permease [Aliagarivorans taiwanensis]